MTKLGEIFAELGISQYLDEFIEQGFDTWETILDITESDFDALGVKLGHRRKLQRKIANSRGISSDRALSSPRHTPADDRQSEDQRLGGAKAEAKDGGGASHGAKRKYRRHPKPDENAPERPPSAYVIFSNKMREELKGRNLSFTEIAKLVGENWQNLSPEEKEPFEQQAFSTKEKYNQELAEYKKTSSYREYSQYLTEFKTKQVSQQQAPDADAAKRPKLETYQSNTSSGTADSSTSQAAMEASGGRGRVPSSGSSTGPWSIVDNTTAASTPVAKSDFPHRGPSGQGSPSPTLLPGYRESIFGGIQQGLPWRDGKPDDANSSGQKLPRLANVYDRRSSYASTPIVDSISLPGSAQHPRRTVHNHPPPMLTPEPTNLGNRSTGSVSSDSPNSSAFFAPRTPLEPPHDRPLPLPSLFPPMSSGSSDNQLPPLRPPSLSPQSAMANPQQSPNFPPHVDFSSMAPFRGYNAQISPMAIAADKSDLRAQNSVDDMNLDPVSALLRAGEIVNRNSRSQRLGS
ncbi:uncharacterized protein BP5553_05974 [Venustampulla echinocandica]|uniref:HMG box domain-containing protein n=1 Tax=Venustampulla echinocandica TaxID=2656787 RepID=A0A370TM70_9HELO|nr:uncharacterized protein BP5553_05974 [Venustampulla echinocandica]RDL36622.1 hypothetical protein BP5553_05974 [Venustampulla echinocandica]